MSFGWVAGAIRARALATRTLGAEAIEALGSKASLGDALTFLVGTTYGRDIHPGTGLEAAQHRLGETALWHLRVLAGWLPPRGVEFMKALAAWFEMRNIEERAVALSSGSLAPPPEMTPYRLGSLATSRREAAEADSLDALRHGLAGSDWGDPGSAQLSGILFALRIRWARRLRRALPEQLGWGDSALALAVAKSRYVTDVEGGAPRLEARAVPELGFRWAEAETLAEFVDSLPPSAGWVFAESRTPERLWRAERRWWDGVDREARLLAYDWRLGRRVVAGAAALLVTDCRRAQRGLQRAARRGGDRGAGA